MDQTEAKPLEHLVRDLVCRGKDKSYKPVFEEAIAVPVLISLAKGTSCPLCPYYSGLNQTCHAAAVNQDIPVNYCFPSCSLSK